ncbi:MAG TPA: hypothetical protein DCP31_12180 [Cyanobacteria bacterium UBA8543]|nr:hypothetical protein [Cyanobacteria bacterium UBA8543]
MARFTTYSVENSGLETPTLEDGEFTAGYSQGEPLSGWELYDPNDLVTGIPQTPGGIDFTDAGAWNPTTAQYPSGVPEGENVGYTFATDTPGSGAFGLTQTLDTTLAANTQYTLLVNVGNATGIDPTTGYDYSGFPGYRLELWAGDTLLDYTLNPVAVPEGKFSAVAFSYTTLPGDPIGENLQIRLINENQNPGYEVDFDNVQVVSQPAGNTTSLSSTIVNNDFEEPVLVDGDYTIETPTGWQLYNPNGLIPANPTSESSSVGVTNPPADSDYGYANEVYSGESAAFVFLTEQPGSGVAGISQTLNSVLTANTKYTLLVDVGNPQGADPSSGIDLTGFPGYRVELLAGDTVVAADNNTLQIADGSFATSTVNFTVGADNSLLGQNLGIRLVNLLSGEGIQVDFDALGLRAEQVQDGSQVFIDHAGFELPILEEDTYTGLSRLSNPALGWSTYDPNGLLAKFPQGDPITGDGVGVGVDNYPTPLVYPNGIPEGDNVAFSYVPTYEGGPYSIGEGVFGISQTLDTLLAANTTYTLSVDVGNPAAYFSQVYNVFNDFDGFPGYEVQLLAGGQVIATDHNSLCIADGAFGTSTLSFTTGSDSSYLGQNLGIRLINLNEGPGTEVDFDNVQLTAHAASAHAC